MAKKDIREKLGLLIFSIFFVGSGQILKGESHKGLQLMLVFYFGIPAILYLTMAFSGSLFLVVFGFSLIFAILLWGYGIWDAVKG